MINGTNCIYNKILDHDWFSAHPFLTSSVSNHMGVQFELLLLDTHLIYTSIMHPLKAFLQCLWKALHADVFAQKNFTKDISNSKICYRCD